METQAIQNRLFQTEGRIYRSLIVIGLLSCMSLPVCVAQQPAAAGVAQGGAAQQTVEQAPATPVHVDTSKPMSPKQKQLTDDTAKLQLLANELKTEMDKSSKDTLSLGVIKKAEEVEKLAHKVEDEMKASLVN
jgi:hypothetical protein